MKWNINEYVMKIIKWNNNENENNNNNENNNVKIYENERYNVKIMKWK